MPAIFMLDVEAMASVGFVMLPILASDIFAMKRMRRHRLRHARHRAGLLQILEDLLGRREAEIGQHHHDLLLVGLVALIVDDERRGHQKLFLQALMRVHPERAAEAQGKVVIGAAAGGNRRAGNPRHAVLPPWRRHPVPMDQARLADPVFDANTERLAHLGGEAKVPVRLSDAVDRRRLAVYLDVAALKAQDRRRRCRCRSSFAPGRGRARRAAREKRASGQHARPPLDFAPETVRIH